MSTKCTSPALIFFAQNGIGLIRGAEADRVGDGQRPIHRLAGGGAAKHAHLEWPPGRVLGLGADRQCARYGLGATRRGKAAETDCVPVVDQSCRFVGRQYWEGKPVHDFTFSREE